MRHGSLFSGIGGFDLAAQWMGWENVFHCEWNPFGQKVLKHYWPNAESFNDITKSDFTKYANTIDVLSGGFPCQPYSTAGKRKGKEDERHLWPEMLRAIREISPCYVVGENVRGLTNWNGGMVFDEVQADLEAEGYEVLPFLLPACGVGAPHRRDRIWFIAYFNSIRGLRAAGENEGKGGKEWVQERNEIQQPDKSDSLWKFSSDTAVKRLERGEWWTSEGDRPSSYSENATNASHQGLQGGEVNGGASGIGQERNKQFARLLSSNWQEFPTQSPLCNGNDGFSAFMDSDAFFREIGIEQTRKPSIGFAKWRVESIKAGGNAIVPQVALEIFKAIENFDKHETFQ
jgi:DNA (cytosine-5)-methyltransferase 1